MRCVIFILFFLRTSSVGGDEGGGCAARLFLLFSFPCSADHERDWPPCKVAFSGLVRASPRQYTVDPMLLPEGNPFICHEEVLSLQPVILPKRFDIFAPDWGMLRRSKRVQFSCVQFFLKHHYSLTVGFSPTLYC